MVDCARAAILMPLGTSILYCKPVNKCSLVETAFLLLVTVSTVNLLTTVLNDAPVLPDDDDDALQRGGSAARHPCAGWDLAAGVARQWPASILDVPPIPDSFSNAT